MTPHAQLSDTEFQQVQRIVYKAAGLAIAENGRILLSSRVRKRLKILGLESFRDYIRLLSSDPNGTELTAFLDAVCSKETSFFRTPSHFDWFISEFLSKPKLADEFDSGFWQEPGRGSFRVWSAACSSGEEAYSLAIILLHHKARLTGLNVQLFASDLSTSVIEYAKDGLYSSKDIAKLDVAVQNYFEPDGVDMRVKSVVRKQVQFFQHNLMQPAPHKDLDCLFLRNVLIYFDKASKAKVLGHVIDAIRPGGFLVTGPSEGVFDIPFGLQRIKPFLFRRC